MEKGQEDLSVGWNALPSDQYNQRVAGVRFSMDGIKNPTPKIPSKTEPTSLSQEEANGAFSQVLDVARSLVLQERADLDSEGNPRTPRPFIRPAELAKDLQSYMPADFKWEINEQTAREILEKLEEEGVVGQATHPIRANTTAGRAASAQPREVQIQPTPPQVATLAIPPAYVPASVRLTGQMEAQSSPPPSPPPPQGRPDFHEMHAQGDRSPEYHAEIEREEAVHRAAEAAHAARELREDVGPSGNYLEAEWEAHRERESAAFKTNPEVVASEAALADIRNRCGIAKVNYDQLQKSYLGPIEKLRAYFGKKPGTFVPKNDRERQIVEQYQNLQQEYDQKREAHQQLIYQHAPDPLEKKRAFANFVLEDEGSFRQIQFQNAPPSAKWIQNARWIASKVGFDNRFGRIAWGVGLGTLAALPMATVLGAIGLGAGAAGVLTGAAVATRTAFRADTEFNGPLRQLRDRLSNFYGSKRAGNIMERHEQRVAVALEGLQIDRLAEAANAIRTSVGKVERSNRRTALRRMIGQTVGAAIIGGGVAGGVHEAISIFGSTGGSIEALHKMSTGLKPFDASVPAFSRAPMYASGLGRPEVPSEMLPHGEIPPLMSSGLSLTGEPMPGFDRTEIPPLMATGLRQMNMPIGELPHAPIAPIAVPHESFEASNVPRAHSTVEVEQKLRAGLESLEKELTSRVEALWNQWKLYLDSMHLPNEPRVGTVSQPAPSNALSIGRSGVSPNVEPPPGSAPYSGVSGVSPNIEPPPGSVPYSGISGVSPNVEPPPGSVPYSGVSGVSPNIEPPPGSMPSLQMQFGRSVEVLSSDSKKGLWGVLERQLSDPNLKLTPGERGFLVDSYEKYLLNQEKLHPGYLKSLGFSGPIDVAKGEMGIRVGDHLNLTPLNDSKLMADVLNRYADLNPRTKAHLEELVKHPPRHTVVEHHPAAIIHPDDNVADQLNAQELARIRAQQIPMNQGSALRGASGFRPSANTSQVNLSSEAYRQAVSTPGNDNLPQTQRGDTNLSSEEFRRRASQ